MALVKCVKCGESYHRPRKQDEVKEDFINCPSCGEAGKIPDPPNCCAWPHYHTDNKKMSAVDLLMAAIKDS